MTASSNPATPATIHPEQHVDQRLALNLTLPKTAIEVQQQTYLAALGAVQRHLMTPAVDRQVIYQRVLQELGQVCGASRAYLFTNVWDGAGRLWMRQQAEWCAEGAAAETIADKIRDRESPHSLYPDSLYPDLLYADYAPRWAAQLGQGQPIVGLVSELPDSERERLQAQEVRSVLLLPLMVQQQFFGFIRFDNCWEARLWQPVEIELLTASTAAISLFQEHWLAEETLRKQADRERLLATIAARIRQSLDLQEILDRTTAEVQQFLQVERVLIYRFESESSGVLTASSVAPEWSLDNDIQLHQVWYRDRQAVYEYKQCYVVNDMTSHGLPALYVALMQRLGVQAKMVVPILQGEKFWGVLTVHQCSCPRVWQPFEVDLLEQLATQAAIAIQQAQLFSQVQQQAQREQLLNQISRDLNSSLDPERILQKIVDRTGECFQVDRVLILISDGPISTKGYITVQQEWRTSDETPSMLKLRVPLTDFPNLLDFESDLHQRRVFYAPDYCQLPLTETRRYLAETKGLRSLLSAPIFIRDELFGMVSMHTVTKPRTFSSDEIQLLQRIADQAAIALYNAQSYERLEQLVTARTQELEQEKRISESANRAKSEFLATMSHELRTPLNAVLGLSDVLNTEVFGTLNSKQAEYVSHIHSSGEHLLQLINDILDLAKVESGRESLVYGSIPVLDLCHYCLTLVQEQAHDRGLTLICQIDPAIETCIADERRLRQMLLNLLSNAVKFTPKGSVSLVVGLTPDGISFSVRDTGIGIAPEQRSSLFQPFSQLDSQINRRYPGTGLGLSLTRNLARLHGGDVTVDSELGKGSCFTLYLPQPQSGQPPVLEQGTLSEPVQPRQSGRILVVEDDRCSALLIQDYLQAIGYQVQHLSNGTDFLPQVRAFQPNLILMDMQLNGGPSGLDLLQTLRKQPDLPEIPVAMVTAMAMAGDREHLLSAGANAYLSKPLEIVQLELLLGSVLKPSNSS